VDIPRMTFNACQDRAVALVAAALAHDALSFGAVAKGKKLDMLLDYVDLVAERFVRQTLEAPELVSAIAHNRLGDDVFDSIVGNDVEGDLDE
jgi:hypothetical protein